MNRDYAAEAQVIAHQGIKEGEYWQAKLAGEPVKFGFPWDYRRKLKQYEQQEIEFTLPDEIFSRLLKLSNKSDARLHIILAAGLLILLYKYTGNTDIIIGMPVYKQQVEGQFINTILALRSQIDEEITFKEYLLQVRQTVIEAVENQNYPIETLLYKLNLFYSEEDDFPLFDAAVLLENIHDKNYIRHIRLNTIFFFSKTEEALSGVATYNSLCYKKTTLERIIDHFKNILQYLCFKIDTPLVDIDILSKEEKNRVLYDFNHTDSAYPKDRTIRQLFEEQVERTPDRIAVVFPRKAKLEMGDEEISFSELNRRANRLARILREKGVKADTIVALMLERSIEMIIAIMAVLKAGGAYFPMDCSMPENRILSLLKDYEITLMATMSSTIAGFSFAELKNLRDIRSRPYATPPRSQIKNLDDLPFPDRSLIDYEKYNRDIGQAMVKNAMSLQATRGCPYRCAYCHKIWPKSHVARSAENIFAEVKFYYDLGVRRFAFVDDIFNLNIENSSRFFRLIIREGLDVQLFFPSGFRSDILTKDYIDLMVEAGTVSFAMALETASPRLQKLIGKNLDLQRFRENIEYVCRTYPQVISELFTMHGFPSETQEEARLTLDFIKSLHWVHFPYINILKIYPNTDMERIALENGISREAILASERYYHHEFSDSLPFEKSFTLNYQAEFLNDYFLSKERLLHVLPFQMQVLSREEIILKYDSYLPVEVKSFPDLLRCLHISETELREQSGDNRYSLPVPNLDREIKSRFSRQVPHAHALKILLLDLSQPFTSEPIKQYNVVEPPLGLLNLAACLNREFGPKVNAKIAKSRIDFDNYLQLEKLVKEFKPGIIGLRTLIIFKDFFHKTAAMIRQWAGNVPIITGGPYASSSYETILQDPNIDLVVRGEGEITFSELIGKMIENKGRLPEQATLRQIPGLAFISGEKIPARDIIMLDCLADAAAQRPDENLDHGEPPQDLAYLISTSGSTGRPKGVMIEQRNVNFLVNALQDRIYIKYAPEAQLNTALIAPYFFDASVKQVFAALLKGRKLCITPEDIRADGEDILEFYNRFRIDISDGTPTLLRLLLEIPQGNSQLAVKQFLIGGESLPIELARDFFNRFAKPSKEQPVITNVYGPTECTVDAAGYDVTPVNIDHIDTIPIGRPLADVQMYVLDKRNRPQPIGVCGEICIGGGGPARGYLNNPELTAEKFVSNYTRSYKSYKSYMTYSFKKMYRTGDMGRWLADGNIEFLGRSDYQVKVRGYRIELAEIEGFLLKNKAIKAAVVTAKEDRVGDKYLCAYIVPDPERLDSSQEAKPAELKKYLSALLPEYMIPGRFVQLAELPLTKNGKVDRRALPEPGTGGGEVYAAPRDEIDEKLAKIWRDLLIGNDTPPADLTTQNPAQAAIGIDDNFFECGGHSLKATILVARMHKVFDIKIPLLEIFKTPTIRGLSQCVKKEKQKRFTGLQPVEKKTHYILSTAMKRLYYDQQRDVQGTIYNISSLVELTGEIDTGRLQNVFRALIARHESLRTSFVIINEEPVQQVRQADEIDFTLENYNQPDNPNDIPRTDTRSPEEKFPAIRRFQRSFDLSRPPLLRAGLVKIAANRCLMMTAMHHIAADGSSAGILIKEFMSLLDGKTLPVLKIQYKDYSEWQNKRLYRESDLLEKQENFWLKRFKEKIPALTLPGDFPRPPLKRFSGDSFRTVIANRETLALKRLALETDATLFTLLLAIFNVFLFKLSGQEDIVVGAPLAGRRHADLEPLLGMFVNMLALRSYPTGGKTFRQFLAEVKERTLLAFENQDYPFERLVEKTVPQKDPARNPLFDVFFSLQNMDLPEIRIPGLKLTTLNPERKTARFDLGFHVFEGQGQLFITVEYSTALFKKETIERFIGYFKEIANQVVQDRTIKLAEIRVSHDLLVPEIKRPALEFDF